MKIGIIGAGYSGLTIAKELIEKGQDVTIFERQPYVGGMVDTIEICGTRLEKYYRHIFKSDKEAIKLIKDMGLEDELKWPATKMGYLTNKTPYLFGTPISLLKFKPLNFVQKLRFGFNVIHIKLINDYKKLEKVTAEKWLKDKIGDNIYSKVWEPLLISKFGEKKDKVSMAWLWGKIKLRSTSSTPEGEQLGYIKGSYQKLTDKFYKYLIDKGVNIKLNTSVNEVLKDSLTKFDSKYEVVIVTGKNYYEEFQNKEKGKNVFIFPYIDDLSRLMKVTDVLVTRAGATTLSEIMVTKTPSILVPSPYVTENHQYKNAMYLVNKNAGVLLEEKNLTPKTLVDEVNDLINNPNKCLEIKDNLENIGKKNSATLIYNEIKELLNDKK